MNNAIVDFSHSRMITNSLESGQDLRTEQRAILDQEIDDANYQVICDALKEATNESIKVGEFDQVVVKLIGYVKNGEEYKKIERLKDIAYSLFADTRRYNNQHLYSLDLNLLKNLFCDEKVDTDLLAKVLLNTFQASKEYITESAETPSVEEGKSWNPVAWYKETTIKFVHAGGRRHIRDMMAKKAKTGYRCEAYGNGIFISPIDPKIGDLSDNQKTSTITYLARAALNHFDDPDLFVGEIEKDCIIRPQNQAYEAIIPLSNFNKIKAISKEKFEVLKLMVGSKEKLQLSSLVFKKDVDKKYTDEEDREKIWESMTRVIELKMESNRISLAPMPKEAKDFLPRFKCWSK